MFTGIVEHLGTALSVTDVDRGRIVVIDVGPLAASAGVGDSVAVNGACLTVVEAGDGKLTFEAVGETLDRTALGTVEAGDPLNLELPMPAGGRFDGHIVQGHVDGVGRITAVEDDGNGRRLTVAMPDHLMRYVAEKGSITLDGVSLTVAALDTDTIDIALIPHTLAVTTLGSRRVGDPLNVEVDVLAKYVERLIGASS